MSRMYINPTTFDTAKLTENEVPEFIGFMPIVDYCQNQANTIAALRAENAELREALTRILSNPLFQDKIASNKITAYLDRDARSILAKWSADDILKREG